MHIKGNIQENNMATTIQQSFQKLKANLEITGLQASTVSTRQNNVRDESEPVLIEKLKYLSEQKDKLNQGCPQVPRWAYNISRKGIKDGEGDYAVDKKS